MSTLLEIEEAIKSLPSDQIAELACWLDDMLAVRGMFSSQSEDEGLKGRKGPKDSLAYG